jgi:hypothetical protein
MTTLSTAAAPLYDHRMAYIDDNEHLYELLGMLPPASEKRFWTAVAEDNDVGVGYIFEKMSYTYLYRNGADPSPYHGVHPGDFSYLIMFFGGDKPLIWEAINYYIFNTAANDSVIGQCMARDIAEAAWRVIVGSRVYFHADRMQINDWRHSD